MKQLQTTLVPGKGKTIIVAVFQKRKIEVAYIKIF